MEWDRWEEGAPLWGFGTIEEIGVKDRQLYFGHPNNAVLKLPLPNFYIRYPDKVFHFLGWGALAYYLGLRLPIGYAIGIPVIVGLIWEFVLDKAPSWRDMVAKAIGIALGVWLC